jgi:hypothetical protein
MRWSLLFCVIAPVCCPLAITSSEGHIGAIWLFGHIRSGRSDYYVFSRVLAWFYQIVVIFPIIVIYSTSAMPWHPAQFVDLMFGVTGFVGVIVLALKYPGEAAGPARALLAPLLVLAPCWLYSLTVWRVVSQMRIGDRISKAPTDSELLGIEAVSNSAAPSP